MKVRTLYYLRIFGLGVNELREFAEKTNSAIVDARQDGRHTVFPMWRQSSLAMSMGDRYFDPSGFSCMPDGSSIIVQPGTRVISVLNTYDGAILICDCTKNPMCQIEMVSELIARSLGLEVKPLTPANVRRAEVKSKTPKPEDYFLFREQ